MVMPRISLDVIQSRIRQHHSDLVSLDVSTYVHSTKKATYSGKDKWEWFHNKYPSSQLWIRQELIDLGILS